MDTISPYIILVAAVVMCLDLLLLLRFRLQYKKQVIPPHEPNTNFTILVPIFGHTAYLQNLKFLSPYREQVVLCTTDQESETFYPELENIAKANNFQIFVVGIDQKKMPGDIKRTWKLFQNLASNSLHKEQLKRRVRNLILEVAFRLVNSDYVVLVDGDTYTHASLNDVVGIMDQGRYDLASVNIIPARTYTLLQKLQAVEYALMSSVRKHYPWFISDTAMVARVAILQEMIRQHSLISQKTDIDLNDLTVGSAMRLGHIPVDFFTTVPATLGEWFRQRVGWFAGGFHYIAINIQHQSWRYPFYFFYLLTFVTTFGVSNNLIRLELILVLPIVYIIYSATILITTPLPKQSYMWLYVPYSLGQMAIFYPYTAGMYMYSYIQKHLLRREVD